MLEHQSTVRRLNNILEIVRNKWRTGIKKIEKLEKQLSIEEHAAARSETLYASEKRAAHTEKLETSRQAVLQKMQIDVCKQEIERKTRLYDETKKLMNSMQAVMDQREEQANRRIKDAETEVSLYKKRMLNISELYEQRRHQTECLQKQLNCVGQKRTFINMSDAQNASISALENELASELENPVRKKRKLLPFTPDIDVSALHAMSESQHILDNVSLMNTSTNSMSRKLGSDSPRSQESLPNKSDEEFLSGKVELDAPWEPTDYIDDIIESEALSQHKNADFIAEISDLMETDVNSDDKCDEESVSF